MDIRAKSELRRKKILANADARLKKLCGRIITDNVETDPVEIDNKSRNGSMCNGSHKSQHTVTNQNTIRQTSDIESKIISSEDNERSSIAIEKHESGLQSSKDTCMKSEENSKPNNALERPLLNPMETRTLSGRSCSTFKTQLKLDCLLFFVLGIVVRIMFYIGFSWIFFQNILGPFLIICLPRMMQSARSSTNVPGIYSLMIVCGIRESVIRKPFVILTTLRTILQFFALYMFSFILTDYLIISKDS